VDGAIGMVCRAYAKWLGILHLRKRLSKYDAFCERLRGMIINRGMSGAFFEELRNLLQKA